MEFADQAAYAAYDAIPNMLLLCATAGSLKWRSSWSLDYIPLDNPAPQQS